MENDKTLAMLIYLLSFFSAIVGPLIIWLVKKDESEFIDFHGKQYFNFFISFAIYSVASMFLMIVLIGFVLIFVVGIVGFIFTIIAAIKAYEGERYTIPLTIPFIK